MACVQCTPPSAVGAGVNVAAAAGLLKGAALAAGATVRFPAFDADLCPPGANCSTSCTFASGVCVPPVVVVDTISSTSSDGTGKPLLAAGSAVAGVAVLLIVIIAVLLRRRRARDIANTAAADTRAIEQAISFANPAAWGGGELPYVPDDFVTPDYSETKALPRIPEDKEEEHFYETLSRRQPLLNTEYEVPQPLYDMGSSTPPPVVYDIAAQGPEYLHIGGDAEDKDAEDGDLALQTTQALYDAGTLLANAVALAESEAESASD